MTTPGGFDPRHDPTAPSYQPPPSYDAPTYDAPTYEAPAADEPPSYGTPTYGAPTYGSPSLDKAPAEDPAAAWPPPQHQPQQQPQPAGDQGAGWYLAPPSESALPATAEQPGQTGWGYPPGPPPPPPRRGLGGGAVAALVLCVIVVLGIAAVGIAFLVGSGDDDDRRVAGPPAPASSSAASSPATSSPTGSASPTDTATPDDVAEILVPAVTPGFQGVLSQKENVAYDVPEGWEPRSPGTLVGYEDGAGNPVALIHGVSTFLPDACPDVRGSFRGNAGFKTAGTVDPAQAVQDGITVFAQAAALNDDGSSAPVTFGAVADVAVAGGAITAKTFTATVTPPAGGDCGAPSVLFTGAAFTTPSGQTALFVMYLDQGTADALPVATAQQIVASLRPYTG